MKILNKNKKLKRSKMFIDKKVLEKICQAKGSTLKTHMAVLEEMARNSGYVPDMTDVSIILEVYTSITKIIKER